jgi:hypothetical protein
MLAEVLQLLSGITGEGFAMLSLTKIMLAKALQEDRNGQPRQRGSKKEPSH